MFLTNWIDKKVDEIQNTKDFNCFFANVEIDTIDSGKYLFNPEKGINIVMTEFKVITSIHLFSGNTNEAKRFEGPLMHNIDFEMTQAQVRKHLGSPKRNGGGHNSLYGRVAVWDKYHFDIYSLHFQYSALTDQIDLLTITTLKLEPYFDSSLQ